MARPFGLKKLIFTFRKYAYCHDCPMGIRGVGSCDSLYPNKTCAGSIMQYIKENGLLFEGKVYSLTDNKE